MKILGIETALGACSVALLDGDNVVACAHETMARGHAEALAPMVQSVMARSKLSFSELERLAVTTGPGTFTGQRVGLAFVRAMALALKIPAVGVTTLDAMAAQALAQEKAEWAVAASDARRGELYLGARAAGGKTIFSASLFNAEAAAEKIMEELRSNGRQCVVAGSGAEILRGALKAAGWNLEAANVEQPDAVFVARIGAGLATPDAPPKPLYLRAPDAKLPKRSIL